MTEFRPNRRTYVQSHVTLAALCMAGAMIVLWALDNPHWWTGAAGGLAAIALRGWYLMDEELGRRWVLSDDRIDGPGDFGLPLSRLARVRRIGSAVQLITQDGHKHLIKFQADPEAVKARIDSARVQRPQT